MEYDSSACLDFFQLNEIEALKRCQEHSFAGTGPGGQHRNRVRTGIRLTHKIWNLSGECSQYREGKRNRTEALLNLRVELAFLSQASFDELVEVWQALPKSRINSQNPKYPIWLMCVCALFREGEFEVSSLKKQSFWSSSAILRQCARDSRLWQWIQTQRQQRELKPLKSPL